MEPAAHMFPSDLEIFAKREYTATAYSVVVGSPDEKTEPLFRWADIEQALADACAAEGLDGRTFRGLILDMKAQA
jgi:hypothetical protein